MRKVHLFVLLTFFSAATHAAESHAGLRLVLETDKAAYAPSEPIVLRYWVENISQTVISVPGITAASHGWIKFEVAGQEGKFQPYRTGHQVCSTYTVTALKPGERLSSELIAVTNAYGAAARSNLQFAGMKLFPFSEPGKYRIRATYPLARSDSGETPPALVSNTVEFTVRAASKDEEEALRFFSSPEEYAAAVGGDEPVDDIPSALRHWEEFVEKYPNSVYTPAVRLHLGMLYLNGTGPPQPDPEHAVTHFRAVASGSRQPLAGDALVELAKSLIELGRFDDASATLRTFLEKFPDSERRTEAARLRDGLGKGLRSLREIYSN